MEVRVLDILDRHTAQLIAEMDKVACGDETLCMRSSSIEIKESLESGYSVGVWDGSNMIAFTLCYMVGVNQALVEKCYVDEAYRGQRLQKRMLASVEDLLKADGVGFVEALASPDNVASMRSFEASGFVVKDKDFSYQGQQRNLLEKKI